MASRQKGPRLGDYFLEHRRSKPTFLDEINELIDWKPINSFLRKKIKRKANAVGNPAYPPLAMFKILLLQRWYNLSDPGVEQALLDRLSFIRFVEFSIEDDVPDETTICRFRNGLIRLNVLDKLLAMLNKQLEDKELLVREGAVVDASVVESQRRPRKVIDAMPNDRAEGRPDQDGTVKYQVSYSDDEEAAWLRKRNRAYYGYKLHAATDSRDGFVLCGHITPANLSDTGEFERLVDDVDLEPGSWVYADKGYCSGKNRDILFERDLEDGTMDKIPRGGRLTELEKERNRAISSVRQIVERLFGTLKRGYDYFRARYVGQTKVEGEFHILAMAFNLKKAVRLARTG
ncbi:MAG: IS5 family transposase [Gammaproteobacteria bacterium]|nr:IS5 family transposase [Gammaproteobacteria bacterium]